MTMLLARFSETKSYTYVSLVMKISSPTSLPLIVLIISCSLIIFLSNSSDARDTINQTQEMEDGETLESNGKIFKLGFFTPPSSPSKYLGIWYSFSPEVVVWVANREAPILNNSSTPTLKLTPQAQLVVFANSSSGTTSTPTLVWSSSNSTSSDHINGCSAKLLDSGNLVVTKGDVVVWQSFDYPSDTQLPGMKVGFDMKSGRNWHLTSWKSTSDPSPSGNINIMDSNGSANELYVLRNGVTKLYRVGMWNGRFFSGLQRMESQSYNDFRFQFVDDNDKQLVYYSFTTIRDGLFARIAFYPNLTTDRLVWSREIPRWRSYWSAPDGQCDPYSTCGPNGLCNTQDPSLCSCYKGFVPKSNISWVSRVFDDGCVRKEKLNCSDGEEFLKVEGVKIPDTAIDTIINKRISVDECRVECKNNCSCMAYAAAYIDESGIRPNGCIMWFGDLVDTEMFGEGGQVLFLRLPASELTSDGEVSAPKKTKVIIIGITTTLVVLMVVVGCGCLIWRRNRKKSTKTEHIRILRNVNSDGAIWNENLPLFDFKTMALATNNFSTEIGRGGFGVVYKGKLEDGLEIAVKRNSKTSGQGQHEFMNEAELIAGLQHKNLVRLLGCCIQRQERMLVYEFMQNKSLDTFIFGGRESRELLNWPKRVDIVVGIAHGLIYLHHGSNLNIIHRDLKAANILLDKDMNPRISDFGTARIFGGDKIMEEINTRRIMGTFGYMAPEYTMQGLFSTKSDVFSFGVIMLEIISGKKNKLVAQGEPNRLSLVEEAWNHWCDNKVLEFVDEVIRGSCSHHEAMRLIQIALLCLQEVAADRPRICSVNTMLCNETTEIQISIPNKPWFWNQTSPRYHLDILPRPQATPSTNVVFTITDVYPR